VTLKTTLKQLRKKAGLTRAQPAEAIGTDQRAVAHYEIGIKAPELARLPLIAKALGISVATSSRTSKTAKVRVSPNRMTVKLQKAFVKLKPVEQHLVLEKIEGLFGQK
jgi:transcriptional regulator with XRE-family HTH domain